MQTRERLYTRTREDPMQIDIQPFFVYAGDSFEASSPADQFVGSANTLEEARTLGLKEVDYDQYVVIIDIRDPREAIDSFSTFSRQSSETLCKLDGIEVQPRLNTPEDLKRLQAEFDRQRKEQRRSRRTTPRGNSTTPPSSKTGPRQPSRFQVEKLTAAGIAVPATYDEAYGLVGQILTTAAAV